MSLEDEETAEKRVQQINEEEQQFQPNIEDSAALTQKAEEEAIALAQEAEAQAAVDAEQAEKIVAELKGEGQATEGNPADFEQASTLLSSLHSGVKTAERQIDMGMGTIAPAARASIQELKALLPKVNEAKLAEQFFQSTQGRTEESYQVYMALKGTKFAETFRSLEDARLKAEGYDGFTL